MQPKIFDYYSVYQQAIEQCIAAKEHNEAVLLAKRLTTIYPSLATAHALLAELLLETGALNEASAAAARAYSLDPELEAVALARARVTKAQASSQALLLELRQLLADHPTWWDLRRYFALLLDENGLFRESKNHWEAIGSTTALYEDQASLAICLCHLGERDQAASIADGLLKTVPSTNTAIASLSKLLFALGEFQIFMQLLQNVVGAGICDENIIAEWATLLENSGQRDAALAILQTGMPFSITSLLRGRIAKLEADLNITKTKKHGWRAQQAKRVIFVSELPKIREAKLAYGLRQLGWEVILLHAKPLNANPSRFFDACYSFTSPQEVLDFIHSNDCRLIHLFCAVVDETALTLIREKPGVIIYDTIDVFDGMLYFRHDVMPAQRFCIEQSDAIVARDLQIPYSCRFSGTKRPRDILFFPEYCWDFPPGEHRHSLSFSSRNLGNQEIHLVQAGWINVQAKAGTHQTYYDILSNFVMAGVHVHLYAHMMFQKENFTVEYGDFIQLGEKTGRAHLHDTLPFDQMPEELQQFHIGLSVVPQADLPGHSSRYPKNAAHFASCGSARNTDYLDAGLPILSGQSLIFQNAVLRRYGMPIPFDDRCLKDPLKCLQPYCTQETRRQVLAKRAPYTITKQSPRLASFYNHLHQMFRQRL